MGLKMELKLAWALQQGAEANMPSFPKLTPAFLEWATETCRLPSAMPCALQSLLTSLQLGFSGV